MFWKQNEISLFELLFSFLFVSRCASAPIKTHFDFDCVAFCVRHILYVFIVFNSRRNYNSVCWRVHFFYCLRWLWVCVTILASLLACVFVSVRALCRHFRLDQSGHFVSHFILFKQFLVFLLLLWIAFCLRWRGKVMQKTQLFSRNFKCSSCYNVGDKRACQSRTLLNVMAARSTAQPTY